MKLILDSPNWKLLKEYNIFYFDIRVCCGLVDSSVTMRLSSEQEDLFNDQGSTFLDNLADSLQFKYSYALRNGHFDMINNLVTQEVRNKISKTLTG